MAGETLSEVLRGIVRVEPGERAAPMARSRGIADPTKTRRPAGTAAPAPVGSPSGAPPPASEVEETDPTKRLMQMLEEFFGELNAPLDPNDPAVRQVLDQMRMDTMQGAQNRGVFGPYSENLAQQAYGKGFNQLALQRKGMAANALGMLTGARFNQRDFDYQRGQDQYANQMDLWKFDQGRNAGLGGLIGGGLGAIGGAALGGPAGAAAGWQLGSGLGQGAASFFSPGPPTYRAGGY